MLERRSRARPGCAGRTRPGRGSRQGQEHQQRDRGGQGDGADPRPVGCGGRSGRAARLTCVRSIAAVAADGADYGAEFVDLETDKQLIEVVMSVINTANSCNRARRLWTFGTSTLEGDMSNCRRCETEIQALVSNVDTTALENSMTPPIPTVMMKKVKVHVVQSHWAVPA